MDYGEYQHLTFERKPHGVVLITINRPDVLNATNDRLHWELTQVWLTLDADDDAPGGARRVLGGRRPADGRGQRAGSPAAGPHRPGSLRSRLQHDQPRQAHRLGD